MKRNGMRVEQIGRAILILRGHRVLLDSDLAALYGVEAKALNQAVRRNAERFPADFMFKFDAGRNGLFEITICDLKDARCRNHGCI